MGFSFYNRWFLRFTTRELTSLNDELILAARKNKTVTEVLNLPANEPTAPVGPVELTSKAVKMIKMTRDEEGIDGSFGMRVAVRGGGCSGFEYALDFENQERDNDTVIDYDGLKIYVDAVSSRYLDGTTIDYQLGMSGTGFKFSNPRAVGTCGCGSSFAV